MRHLFVDPVGGIAGDMLVAALVDAGANVEQVLAAVRSLGVPGWSARIERVWRGPFHASRFVVELEGGGRRVQHDGHDHAHGHHHGYGHEHEHAAGGAPTVPAGSGRWADIRAMLEGSALPARARDRAVATFAALAAAEARVHGLPVDDVVFHEVGAVDSIVDIVAACVALELLGVDEVTAGPLPLGGGHTLGDHGWIPLPAPATLVLLQGFVVEGRDVKGETVTPTGAALVAALGRSGSMPAMRVEAYGVGAGTWDPASHPNVVRVVVGSGESDTASEIAELRTHVDSLHPELVPPLVDALMETGALDVFVAPGQTKKGRPAWAITVLAPVGRREAVGDVLFRHGRTLGYRWQRSAREILERRQDRVDTPWGAVDVKVGTRAGEVLHCAPEYEDCARLARDHGVSVGEVSAAALAGWWSRWR